MTNTILQTLVGSRAHGLHSEDADYDYRGVFVEPTSKILSLNYKPRTVNWIEGKEDQTSYEISHFLSLACRSNPSILEVLVAPVIKETEEGRELRELFPHIWNSTDVYNAFTGYSHNQLKKFMDNKDQRQEKYAVAYLRVLTLAEQLLTTGNMSLEVKDPKFRQMLLDIKAGLYTKGDTINEAELLRVRVDKAYADNKDKKTDYDVVNDFLLATRRRNWTGLCESIL